MEQRLKQRAKTAKAIPTASFFQGRKPFFFQEAPPQQNPGIEGVQPVTGMLISHFSRWYRYVPRTFFNAHSFQTTYIGQNSLFLSELAEHYKRPLVSGNCGGVHDRVSGISSPDLHSQHACIRGGERINRPESSLSNKNMLFTKSRTQWSRTELVHKLFIHCSQKGGGHRPVINLKELNQFVEYQHFKIEGGPTIKTKRLFNQDQLKRILPYCPNTDPSPKVPSIHLGRHSMGVRMPSFRVS